MCGPTYFSPANTRLRRNLYRQRPRTHGRDKACCWKHARPKPRTSVRAAAPARSGAAPLPWTCLAAGERCQTLDGFRVGTELSGAVQTRCCAPLCVTSMRMTRPNAVIWSIAREGCCVPGGFAHQSRVASCTKRSATHHRPDSLLHCKQHFDTTVRRVLGRNHCSGAHRWWRQATAYRVCAACWAHPRARAGRLRAGAPQAA